MVEATDDGKFHIYAPDAIENGIEILTGMDAGEQNKDGSYPECTPFNLVEKKLDVFAEIYRKFYRPFAPGELARVDEAAVSARRDADR